jgi:hypothetical protein
MKDFRRRRRNQRTAKPQSIPPELPPKFSPSLDSAKKISADAGFDAAGAVCEVIAGNYGNQVRTQQPEKILRSTGHVLPSETLDKLLISRDSCRR